MATKAKNVKFIMEGEEIEPPPIKVTLQRNKDYNGVSLCLNGIPVACFHEGQLHTLTQDSHDVNALQSMGVVIANQKYGRPTIKVD
jgi:hypothetical protein